MATLLQVSQYQNGEAIKFCNQTIWAKDSQFAASSLPALPVHRATPLVPWMPQLSPRPIQP